jgi:starch phosphorylase
MALAYAIRSEIVDRWIETQSRYAKENVKRVYFLSTEYLFGRSLKQNIINLDIEKTVVEHADKLGICLEDLYNEEEPFDLGNGGKGRLASCIQDSIATLAIPAAAYGLRYDYGAFHQEIKDGTQTEKPYDWLHKGHSWEIVRPEYRCSVNFYGKTERLGKTDNPLASAWNGAEQVVAVPYDFPITGYKNRTVNNLRLWASRASEEFLPDYVNHGDYVRACEEKSRSGTLTKVLFPEEDVLRAVDLRLKQHYFLVSASLQDILRRFKRYNGDLSQLPQKVTVQLSGSSCALAIPELMRLLVDVENMPWKDAWTITRSLFSYTSHAVSKESIETWPVYMMAQILPRHLEIIFEINQKHLDEVRARWGAKEELIRDVSIIQEGEVKRVRLSNLAILGSYCVNGVSAEQTAQLTSKVHPEFNFIVPEKFQNKTNGIAHRRWVLSANRSLSELISKAIGDSWIRRSEDLIKLEPFAQRDDFIKNFARIRTHAKEEFALFVKKEYGFSIDPGAMFDVHCKKIHPYKRQVMQVLHLLSRYVRIKAGEPASVNRVAIFAGKAAPSDQLAKQIIKLINTAAGIINDDPATKGKLHVVFLPDYDVSQAEKIVPAADLSEQIATPGQEACGTGNMKFAINGAITMASKGGSNVELIQRIGEENMIVFGKGLAELPDSRQYQPFDLLRGSKHLTAIFSLLEDRVARVPRSSLSINPLLSSLKDSDRYFVLFDFDAFIQAQNRADELYNERERWWKKSILSIARSGWFSIDRTVSEYANDIWKVATF